MILVIEGLRIEWSNDNAETTRHRTYIYKLIDIFRMHACFVCIIISSCRSVGLRIHG